jgi:uncharacterized protein
MPLIPNAANSKGMHMTNALFIGRQQELKKFNLLLKKNTASLVVIKGRRRIGKSRLIQEFAKSIKTYALAGLAPTPETTAQGQRDEFGAQLGRLVNQPPFRETDWSVLFSRLASHTRKGRMMIVLDEVSWMGSKDENFLGKLKQAWDAEFKSNPQLIMVLCGSVTPWIEKNILSSTGFLGRISLDLTLEELPLADCNKFWGIWGNGANENISAYEKFKVLSVTGGVPKYLEEILPQLPAEENIRNLCFDPSGLLFREFNQIFTDAFAGRSATYRRIVECLADGMYEAEAIYKKLNVEKSGAISEYLDELVKSSFVRRDYTWDLKKGKVSKFSRYRISDNYLRFYLNYIEPHKEQIEHHSFADRSLTSLPGWATILGLQFENLVLNNRPKIWELLGIDPGDIIFDNPYFQNKTTRQEGCQIDYLIQTRFDTLYVCEIKFSRHPVGMDVVTAMREKIGRLKVPRNISRRPILIHVNGVSDEVLEARYFADVIDFGQLLQ